MIDTQSTIWFLAGACMGVLHAVSLWRAVQRCTALMPFWGGIRLLGVAGLLFFAALSGVILAVASGWFVAFAISCGWLAAIGGVSSKPTVGSGGRHEP